MSLPSFTEQHSIAKLIIYWSKYILENVIFFFFTDNLKKNDVKVFANICFKRRPTDGSEVEILTECNVHYFSKAF